MSSGAITEAEKECCLCKEIKPLSRFGFIKNKGRFSARCKPCARLYGRLEYTAWGNLCSAANIRGRKVYYEKHKEKLRAKSRAWYHKIKHRDSERERRKLITENRPEQKKNYRETSLKHHLRTMYGLTVEQRDALFAKNNGMCWICSKAVSTDVDHDHVTGAIRGALCRKCNNGLGLFNDDPDALMSAVLYLKSERTFQ